jgi:hypothetical protein
LPRYARRRAGPQHARITGAQVLYEVLKGATPDMDLVRRGLLRYWQQSKNGRSATMALLSLHDERMASVIREYLEVCRYALPLIASQNARSRAVLGLSTTVFNFIRHSMPFMEEELSLRFERL